MVMMIHQSQLLQVQRTNGFLRKTLSTKIIDSVDSGWGKQTSTMLILAPCGSRRFRSFESRFTHLLNARRAFQEHIPYTVSLHYFLPLRINVMIQTTQRFLLPV